LATWRREREAGVLQALTPQKRGPKSKSDPVAEENQQLRRETQRLTEELRKAESGSRRMDETYIKVHGQWVYLHRAVDKAGVTPGVPGTLSQNSRDSVGEASSSGEAQTLLTIR
jgi:hypothetical protein